jgi:cytoskeletal protein CcmA (bactofilin family)
MEVAMKIGNSSRRDMGSLKNDWQTRPAADEDDRLDDVVADASYQAPAKRWEDQVEKAAAPDDCSSIIGAGSVWQGNFSTDGSVRLDGKVSGEVKAAGTVHITDGAQVNAVIQARFVVIAGSFDGQLYCSERLELLPSSRMKGSITTPQISVGEGAFIDGEIHMVEESGTVSAPAAKSFATVKPLTSDVGLENEAEAAPTNGYQTGNVTSMQAKGQGQAKAR